MFDRIGRIADETPFVVEWFVKNGIRVWSTQEGEQRFDNHTDKLTNYIRFWQADGESEKTSIRTKTALGQLVEAGGFRGGIAPYGYDLAKSGKLNKRKHELFELTVNESEAAVVRLIYDKYAHEGYGAQRIATYLNHLGYQTRAGKPWHHSTIRAIVKNLTYTGVLRSGESRSEVLPHLQIVSPELFADAQRIRTLRADSVEEKRASIPRRTGGRSLLSGNVFCAHCGSRLNVTTSVKSVCREDPKKSIRRYLYVCYGKKYKRTACNGQTGYAVHILDGIIDRLVRQLLTRLKAIPKEEIINNQYRERMAELQARLCSIRGEYAKAMEDMELLKVELVKVLRGESSAPKEFLFTMISEAENKCAVLQEQVDAAQIEYNEGQTMLASLNARYDDIISWAEMYDTASPDAKKMIVNSLITRVEVSRGYKVHVQFSIDFQQFYSDEELAKIVA